MIYGRNTNIRSYICGKRKFVITPFLLTWNTPDSPYCWKRGLHHPELPSQQFNWGIPASQGSPDCLIPRFTSEPAKWRGTLHCRDTSIIDNVIEAENSLDPLSRGIEMATLIAMALYFLRSCLNLLNKGHSAHMIMAVSRAKTAQKKCERHQLVQRLLHS